MKTICRVLVFVLSMAEMAMAGACPPGPPTSHGNGQVAGVAIPGGSRYFMKDALLANFDCFEQLSSWFPSYFHSSNSIAATQTVVDMAYASEATATFFNVVAPTTGNYTLAVRYAYASGLFPGVTVRPEGIMVNGVIITNDMQFPITGNFETFEYVSIVIPLNAGTNTVQMFNVASDGVSRVDVLDITAGGIPPACSTPPSAPSGLSATTVSTSQINLAWSGSTAPPGCTVGFYDVFRSTTAGFTPSGSNQIASGLTATSDDDTTAACGTTYYYAVEAFDSAGASVASSEANATTAACPTTSNVQINAGGPAVSPFVADIDFAGGGTVNHANMIDVSGVSNPAPALVYQTGRTGNFSYTILNFTPGSSHTIRLHFAETYFSSAGSRTFHVSINGTQVLTNFDIFASAGAKNKAVIEQFIEGASSTGQYVITFTSVVNNSLVSGIEVQ
jgi:hypothetical protein